MSESNLLEEGEIESDPEGLLLTRDKIAQQVSPFLDVKIEEKFSDNFQKKADKPKGSRRTKRRRGGKSKDRNAKYERTKSKQIDPVEIAELDEYEMLCIRGASPQPSASEQFQPILDESAYYELNERDYRYDSEESYTKRRSPPVRRRRERSRRRQRRNRRHSPEKSANRKSISCDEFDDADDRKMEICKFYLLDCCVKRTVCKYMHSEFPCKYFYLGLDCAHGKPCKFSHGKQLSEEMTQALARHIAAAPKAILGNFKRLSRDKALSMIEAKNRQLSQGEGNADKNCPTNEQLKSDKIIGQQEISEIFSTEQIEKIAALGITTLTQVNQMSLAQLSDIGLSIGQIGEIQRTAKHAHFVQPIMQQSPPTTCPTESHVTQPKDMDMRQLLMLPVLNNDFTNCTSTYIGENDAAKNFRNFDEDEKQLIRDELNQREQFSNISHNLIDDEPELIIDETADFSGSEFDAVGLDRKLLPTATEENSTEPNTNSDVSKVDVSDPEPIKDNESSSDISIFDDISFDEPYEPTNFYAERNESDFEGNNGGESINNNSLPALGDFDMRLPFISAMTNYVPAMEIDGSLKSHLGVPYKLIEIIIPAKKDMPSHQLQSISEHTLDPRLKKLLHIKKKSSEQNFPGSHIEANGSNFIPTSNKTDFPEMSLDPRKRKDQIVETAPKSAVPNYNYVLNSYLQKSKWYQNLNSKNKIEINQHLAELTSELNRFTQNPLTERQFLVSSLQNGRRIQDILFEIGLEVYRDGSVQEATPAPQTDPTNTLNPEHQLEIPSLLTMNLNTNPANYQPNNSAIALPLPMATHSHYEFPKPGLLGIAPGIEMPQYLALQNNLANFHGVLNPRNWTDCMTAFPIHNGIPNICPDQNDLNRNQFPLQMRKCWNRKGNNKKKRI